MNVRCKAEPRTLLNASGSPISLPAILLFLSSPRSGTPHPLLVARHGWLLSLSAARQRASQPGRCKMKEAQQRGQANYSHTQLRAGRDRTHQQTVWVINTFCYSHSHLYSCQFAAKIIKLDISDFYAKQTMQGGLRG